MALTLLLKTFGTVQLSHKIMLKMEMFNSEFDKWTKHCKYTIDM